MKIFILTFLIFFFSVNLHAQINTKGASYKSSTVEEVIEYSDSYISIKYPKSWRIMQEHNMPIILHIMAAESDNFMANINIIKINKKMTESTSELADLAFAQNQKAYPCKFITKQNNINISNRVGSKIISSAIVEGYNITYIQYVLKKADNTVFLISCAIDSNKSAEQTRVVENIVKTLKIK